MNELVLTGLKADLPIGAMAAFGAFRLCDALGLFGRLRLRWKPLCGHYCAVLVTSDPIDTDRLVSALVECSRTATGQEFAWAEQLKKTARNVYVRSATDALNRAAHDAHTEADWFAAFGSELIVDEEHRLEPTPFDMTVARQKFLADAQKLAQSLARKGGKGASSAESFREALFGPWRYRDDQHSLGFDPSTTRLGAFTSKAPTEMANAGVRAAVWLALQSLPLFPCFCVDGDLQTRGLSCRNRTVEFSWPVWLAPISLPALKSLLGLAAITRDPVPMTELRARGVEAVYRSKRAKPNKYIVSFQPAVLCAGP